jgi:stage V sporulation protein D (sporulation-specific penicillin-binding protein)
LLEGKNHYTVLGHKLTQEQSEKIEQLLKDKANIYRGIRILKEHYRYYPEQSLAAQILGYVNSAGIGQYGIEGRYNHILIGKAGFIQSQKDAEGGILTVGDSKVQKAEDGANITLTIDRAIQLEVEDQLAKGVKDFKAENGQVIIMNPKTGEILAMANYPTFNPNDFTSVFDMKEIKLSDAEIESLAKVDEGENQKFYFYTDRNLDRKFEVFKDPEIPNEYYRYDNFVGSEAYRNKTITDLYEPGSTFKVIAMSSAIDTGEVEPYTTHNCAGPIKVPKKANPQNETDYYTIKTFNNQYHGRETMTQVLENSCNIGMSFVAKKLGENLFYNYMMKFGYGGKTNIEFDNENSGQIEYYKYWDESELLTHGFGQGISVTPIQHVTAVSALANKGLLMQPYIVKQIEYSNGKKEIFEPQTIDQVITKETSDKISAMMVSVTENGQAKRAQVDGHFVAGKTGSSQTYNKKGEALFGAGTTITSFIGFGPVNDPKFVILVKLDRPLVGPYAESSAVPVGQKIMEFLFKYYNIPPDK